MNNQSELVMTQSAAYAPVESANILVVEDQLEVQQAISMLLATLGYSVVGARSPEEALERVAREQFDLVLLDLNYRRDTTSGAEGLELLSLLRSKGIQAPVIAMTAWGSIELAVQAMHGGACDFLQKPWDNSHLIRLVNQHIAREQQARSTRIRQEMEWQEAAAVHRRLMPRELPHLQGFSIAAISRPLGYIGGDYYDVFSMGEKVAICIGDVVGKGVPAALMMSNLQAAVKVTAAHWVDPSDLCHRVNQLACSNGASDKFISFFYAVLDLKTRRLTYCNCGHNPPILKRADDTIERLHAGGTLIGLRSGELFQEALVSLGSGDQLVLFTDGLSEVENAAGEQYGEDRIAQGLRMGKIGDAEETLDSIMQAVSEHCGGTFTDDATALVLSAL
jgi:sigma-B regulation protein RsbU (phosphoserine phosphatase)